MRKKNGDIINGKKYKRGADFKRDDTKTLIAKANKRNRENNEIVEILKKRKQKAIKQGKMEIIKAIDEFFDSLI